MHSDVMGSQLRCALSSGVYSQCKGLLLGLSKQESGRIISSTVEGVVEDQWGTVVSCVELWR